MQPRDARCSSKSIRDFGRMQKQRRHLHLDDWRPVSDDSKRGLWPRGYRGRQSVLAAVGDALQQYDSFSPGIRSSVAIALLPEIEEAISESRAILKLPENWDEEGAARIDEHTWSKAVNLLRRAAFSLYETARQQLPVPRINPCADGSIDLYWKTDVFTLLINVKKQDGVGSDFYGERTATRQDIRGPLNVDEPDFEFLNWLVK